MRLTCKNCRTYLTAYLHHELTPRARRRVELHLNGCSSCAAEYTRQSHTARDLSMSIGGIGQPSRDQLTTIWAAVQADMDDHPSSAPPKLSLRVSAFVFIMMFAVLLPPLVSSERAFAQIPDPPTPFTTHLSHLVSPESCFVSAASTGAPRSRMTSQTHLIALVHNIAPTPGATEQP